MTDEGKELRALRAALAGTNRHAQAEAAIRLGQMGDRHSADEIRRLADAEDDLVAIAAMYGSWQLGVDAVDIDRLLAGAGSDDEELMQQSVLAVGEMGESLLSRLIDRLSGGAAQSVTILRLLAEIGGEQAKRAISAFEPHDEVTKVLQAELLEDWDA